MNLREMKKSIMIELAYMTWEEPVWNVSNLYHGKYKTLREFLEWKLEIRTKAQKKRFEKAIYQVQVTLGR